MSNIQWKDMPSDFHKNIPADIADKELMKIYKKNGKITPELIIQTARNKRNPLNKCFTWDDTEAAKEWRLAQAKGMIRYIVKTIPDVAPSPIRSFEYIKKDYKVEYHPIEFIVRNEESAEAVKSRFIREINTLQARYQKYEYLRKECERLTKLGKQIKF